MNTSRNINICILFSTTEIKNQKKAKRVSQEGDQCRRIGGCGVQLPHKYIKYASTCGTILIEE